MNRCLRRLADVLARDDIADCAAVALVVAIVILDILVFLDWLALRAAP